MKLVCASVSLVLMAWATGSPVAAQAPTSTSPQAVPLVTAPAPVRPSSQAQMPNGASRPGATAADLGPIIATGSSVAYVSAESIGHPAVFLGSDASSYGIVGTFTNHPLGFRTNNIARMFIDTSGNVGIGTMGPGYRLDVSGDANITGTYRVNGVPISATSNWTQSGNNIFYTTGNVSVGTTSPSPLNRLTVVSDGLVGHAAVIGDGGAGVGILGSLSTGVYGAGYGNAVGVYGTSANAAGVYGISTYSYAGYFDGNVYVNGVVCAVNIACASDVRLKQNITPLAYGLREVLRLRPAKWEWRDPSTAQLNLGLVAQEVEAVLPELILQNVDMKGSLGLNHFGFVPVMIKAIQEQQDIIATLKAENASLDARIRVLEQALQQSREQ